MIRNSRKKYRHRRSLCDEYWVGGEMKLWLWWCPSRIPPQSWAETDHGGAHVPHEGRCASSLWGCLIVLQHLLSNIPFSNQVPRAGHVAAHWGTNFLKILFETWCALNKQWILLSAYFMQCLILCFETQELRNWDLHATNLHFYLSTSLFLSLLSFLFFSSPSPSFLKGTI